MAAPEFTLTEMLQQGPETSVSRALRRRDRCTVLLRVTHTASVREIERLRRELELGRALGPAAVRPAELTTYEGRSALVLEDFGGEPLDRLLRGPTDVGLALEIAHRIALRLGEIHGEGIVHRDVKPQNVFFNPRTGELRLSGFGIASVVSEEHPVFGARIEGTLAYMSPEQTGRLDRPIDRRSDLYSLGVTLYEMLTGARPFDPRDPLGWIHCHVARSPPTPSDVAPLVPRVLSDLVMNLLAKLPEDRYQTAAGVAADLAECVARWHGEHEIPPFELRTHDVCAQFQVPSRLYGRGGASDRLAAAYAEVRTSGPPQLFLLTGPPGIGKSSVVHSLDATVIATGGLLITGKFEPETTAAPYSALSQALRGLVEQMRAQDPQAIEAWRSRVLDACGANLGVILDLVPSLEPIVGRQPPPPPLGPAEARDRFELVVGRFIGAAAMPTTPVALFLDDLHWADDATLSAVAHILARTGVRHLLVVGASRDGEPEERDRVHRLIEATQGRCTIVHERLDPLSREHVTLLCADTLHAPADAVATLASLLWEKTAGNPLFLIKLLGDLHRDGLLWFDAAEGAWRWEVGRVAEVSVAENVADLLLGSIERLGPASITALRAAACIGSRFEATLLGRVIGAPLDDVHAALLDAVRAGLLSHSGDTYQFRHDRIRDAAYGAISADGRSNLHLRIGRLLLQTLDEAAGGIFEVLSQLDRAGSRLGDGAERDRVAELHLEAARKAKASGAFGPAVEHASAGLHLLGPDAWERRPALTYDLELERAWCELLQGHIPEAEAATANLAVRVCSPLAELQLLELRIRLLLFRNLAPAALTIAAEQLARYGIDLPSHPTEDQLLEAESAARRAVGERPIEEILDLAPLANPELARVMEILAALLPAAYVTDFALHGILASRLVTLTLEHGICGPSAQGCAAFALSLVARGARDTDGLRFGQVALRLAELPELTASRARTWLVVAAFVTPRTSPLAASVEAFRTAERFASEVGDLMFACYASSQTINMLLGQGTPLDDVAREAEHLQELLSRTGSAEVAGTLRTQLTFIRRLRGGEPPSPSLSEQVEDEIDPSALPMARAWHHIRALEAWCILGRHDLALDAAKLAEPLLWAISGQIQIAELHFYAALSHGAAARDAMPQDREAHLAQARRHEHELEAWSRGCPENFFYMQTLLGAERAAVENDPVGAMRLYERALSSARDNGFLHGVALAYELASAHYRRLALFTFADLYLSDARQAYANWGAQAKVDELDRRGLRPGGAIAISTTTLSARPQDLDLLGVLKASQAISGELIRPKLVEALIQVFMEQAGADRGMLLSPDDGGWKIDASSSGTERFPQSIVNAVARTGQAVILNDASLPGAFFGDSYLPEARPRSVLCLPIRRHAALIGVAYLENSLLPGVFTRRGLAVLELLAAQAAISIENATLYADLQREVAERRNAELALSESRWYLQAILDNMVDVIVVCDRTGTITMANPAAFTVLGISSPELIKAPAVVVADMLRARHPDGRPFETHELPVLRALAGELVSSVEMTLYDARAGRDVHLRVNAAPLQDEHGAIVGSMAAGVNVTSAVELDRMKEQFIRAAAHELKTPVAIVKGYAELLRRRHRGMSGPDSRLVQGLVRGADRIDRLASKLLVVWQLQTGRLSLVLESVDLVPLVHEVVRRFGDEAAQRIAFVAEPASLRVRADRQLLGIVLDNLVENALRHSPGGTGVEITISVPAESQATVSICDRGVGIAAEKQEHIFKPFYRAHAETKLDFGGMGVGLYIAKAIVSRHAGWIDFRSREGEGSTFRVTLPVSAEGPTLPGTEPP